MRPTLRLRFVDAETGAEVCAAEAAVTTDEPQPVAIGECEGCPCAVVLTRLGPKFRVDVRAAGYQDASGAFRVTQGECHPEDGSMTLRLTPR